METSRGYPHFSPAEFARRYAALRARMQESDLAALLLYGTRAAPDEIVYLANWPATREAMLIFPNAGEPTLLVQMYNHLPTARRMAQLADVRWGGPDTAETAANQLKQLGLENQRIGLVGPLPVWHDATLKHALPQATFVPFGAQLLQLRLLKSEEELAFLRQGAAFCDAAIAALQREVHPGLSEHDLVAIIQRAYLGQGGSSMIHYLSTTPMSDPSVCVPAQCPSTRVIEQGDVLLTEISAHALAGYPGQILRPFSIGMAPTPPYQRLYEVAIEAFERIAAVMKDGTSSEEVLDIAESIHQAGYTIYDDLLHGYGGGYLPPILRTRRTSARPAPPFVFKENMTIVIQPNVITQDERMGVQVGELVRVTGSGVERLHRAPLGFLRCG
jgi:Xaa-Pro dipeptidase